MKLIGLNKLELLIKQDDGSAQWVKSWVAEVGYAHWKQPSDVARQFPKMRRENDGTFLFPVPRRRLGVQVLVAFQQGLALIQSVKEFEVANGH